MQQQLIIQSLQRLGNSNVPEGMDNQYICLLPEPNPKVQLLNILIFRAKTEYDVYRQIAVNPMIQQELFNQLQRKDLKYSEQKYVSEWIATTEEGMDRAIKELECWERTGMLRIQLIEQTNHPQELIAVFEQICLLAYMVFRCLYPK